MIILLKCKIILQNESSCFVPRGSNRSTKSLSEVVANRRYLFELLSLQHFLDGQKQKTSQNFSTM